MVNVGQLWLPEVPVCSLYIEENCSTDRLLLNVNKPAYNIWDCISNFYPSDT